MLYKCRLCLWTKLPHILLKPVDVFRTVQGEEEEEEERVHHLVGYHPETGTRYEPTLHCPYLAGRNERCL